MRSVAALFVEVASKLEDLHAIATEGQASDALTDMQWALLGMMGVGLSDLEMAVQAIQEALNDA